MNNNKLLIFLIAIIFVLSVNFTFAADNSTDLTLEEIDDQEDIDISLQESESADTLESDDNVEQPIGQEISVHNPTNKPGKVVNRYVDGVIYEATFYESNGAPLTNTFVFCGVNSLKYGMNISTDSNGVAKFPLPLSNGNYKLYLFNPITGDMTTDDLKVFDVLSGGKNMKVYFNSGKFYSVRAFDNDGKPVTANKKVTFLIAYNKFNEITRKVTTVTKKYAVKTDKNGFAKLKINFNPGTYSVVAKYGDFAVFNSITVKPTLIHLTKVNSIGKKTFKFKIKLLNNKGKALKNKKIKVKFNKKTYTAKTNKKGIALFKIKTPKKTGYFKLVSKYKKATASSVLQQYRIY